MLSGEDGSGIRAEPAIRDWVIDKLSIGVTYDPDLDQARSVNVPKSGCSLDGRLWRAAVGLADSCYLFYTRHGEVGLPSVTRALSCGRYDNTTPGPGPAGRSFAWRRYRTGNDAPAGGGSINLSFGLVMLCWRRRPRWLAPPLGCAARNSDQRPGLTENWGARIDARTQLIGGSEFGRDIVCFTIIRVIE